MNSLASTLESHNVPNLQLSSRLMNRKLNIIRHAINIVEKQKGRVTNQFVAEYLGMSVDEYNHILQDANFYRLFNFKQEAA